MIFEKVKDVIVETLSCEADEVELDKSLTEDLGADSLDAIELNMALEEKFDIKIPDEDLAKMVTVEDVVKYIEANK